jgi:magnesium-transporting ATPase (P-type)
VKDGEENNAKCEVIENGVSVQRNWSELQVGWIVCVRENEYFPADLVVISSSGEEGLCYVETKNLDGETNLKNKVAPKQLNAYLRENLRLIDLKDIEIICEIPNKDLYKFDGKMSLPTRVSPTKDVIPLSNDNVLLRGMSLRNTEFAYGIVIYTGPETKIQKNSLRTKYKMSKIMH